MITRILKALRYLASDTNTKKIIVPYHKHVDLPTVSKKKSLSSPRYPDLWGPATSVTGGRSLFPYTQEELKWKFARWALANEEYHVKEAEEHEKIAVEHRVAAKHWANEAELYWAEGREINKQEEELRTKKATEEASQKTKEQTKQ